MSDAIINKSQHMKGSVLDPAVNPDVDLGKRRFLIGATAVTGGAIAASGVFGLASSWAPSKAAEAAGGPIKIDLSKLESGGSISDLFWRKQPIVIVHRTPEMIKRLTEKENLDVLADPDSGVLTQQPEYTTNPQRSIKPEHFVYVSICTHLGCSPEYRPEVTPSLLPTGGFYCPCHGSKFDLAGRVYSGVPAPTNLIVPKYRYETDDLIIIGEDPTAEELAKLQGAA